MDDNGGNEGAADLHFDPEFLEEQGAFNEVNDDFDPLDVPQTANDNYYISDEQERELVASNPKIPKAKDWNDAVENEDLNQMEVSIDKARKFLWKRAKSETFMLRRYWENNHPSFDELCSHLFDEKSEFFQLFQRRPGLDHQTFCRFLATLCTASQLNVPAARLYEMDRFNTTGLLETKEDFLRLIRMIESIDEDNQGETLWMELERIFNTQMRRIHLSKRGDDELSIALDDDKVHFDHSKHGNTCGLKRHRHIKDNRFGHTPHTAGFSATGAILQAAFEREGETSTDCCQKIVKDLFGAQTGNGEPNPQGVTFCSDGGHWTPLLLFFMLLRWGADVVGTVARCAWCPFTFGKMKGTSDSTDKFDREEVSVKGHEDVFHKTLEWVHQNATRKIRAACHRAGTGTAVSLAMSTVHHHGPLFDLNLAFPRDHRDCFDESQTQDQRNAKAFPCVCGDHDESHCDVPKDLPIAPLARAQGDTSWFILRMFGSTSSTADRMISARASEVTPEHDQRDVCEHILSVVDRSNLLPRTATDQVQEENQPSHADSGSESESDDDQPAAVDTGVEFHASNWIRRVNNGEHEMFLLRVETLDENTIKRIVELHANSKQGTTKKLRKDSKDWARCDHPLKRKCFWHNTSQLKARIDEMDATVKKSGLKKSELLSELVRIEEQQSNDNAVAAAGGDPYVDRIDPVLLQAFKASLMKPLKAEAKKCCRQGHELERPFLEQFFRHSNEGSTLGHEALAIFETPLVESSVEDIPRGALDSSDGELIHSFNGSEPNAMPIEIKARLSHSTFFAERNRQEANLGLRAFETDEPTHVTVAADGNDLAKWLPKHKESFQLMHHAAIRDVRIGPILAGNAKKIMFGVFVTHSDELIQAHQDILRDLHQRALSPFCARLDQLHLPMKQIERVVDSDGMKPLGLDIHSFKTNHFVWRRIRLEGDVKLPIPPCNRISPHQHSFWNNMKGASDAATKLFWNCQVKLQSCGRSQTICVGRFFQLHAVSIHRQVHVATAKTDLNQHASLFHFGNGRNRHWPFHETVNDLAAWLIRRANECDAENIDPNIIEEVVPICRTPPRIARDDPRHPFAEDRIHTTVCGATPGRGAAKFPKKKSANWEKDQDRLHTCVGNLFRLEAGKRPHCCLCNARTSFMCLGCKRSHCVANRYDEIHKLILEGDEVVAFSKGEMPPAGFKIKAIGDDGRVSDFYTVENSCHHICHKAAVSRGAATMMARTCRTPFGSVEESSMSRSSGS